MSGSVSGTPGGTDMVVKIIAPVTDGLVVGSEPLRRGQATKYRVDAVEDLLGGAVRLVEGLIRTGFQEFLKQVEDLCSASPPAIDRLFWIPDAEDRSTPIGIASDFLDEWAKGSELQQRGVLELIE